MPKVKAEKNLGVPSSESAIISELKADQRACLQCEANARWNEAGGYAELAAECRAYCLRAHREQGR